MFASQLGIRLLVWVGKTIPMPAPAEILQSIYRVEVVNDSEGDDGFQMVFTLAKQKTGEFDLLQNGLFDPDSRVIIGVVMGAVPEPLIDGVIHHHQLTPGDEPGTSMLGVSGRDVRVMLDLNEVNAQFKNQPDSVIVTQILLKYPQYNLVPTVTPTTNVPLEVQLVRRQHETDLKFIKRLAERNGFVFYIEPLTIGTSTAYWGPQQRTGVPQPKLTYNLGTASNVEEIHFQNDALDPLHAEGTITEPLTKQSVPIPPLPDLRLPPLAMQSVAARRTRLMRRTANRNPATAATDLLAQIMNAPDAVVCTGKLDAVRYGQVLRARRLVNLRGAGKSYDGTYKVSKVRHVFTRTSFTQEFTLKREGIGSLLPMF